MAEMNWQDALAAFERQQSETKSVRVALGEGEIRFEIRQITQMEKDHIEATSLKERRRRRGETMTAEELAALKAAYIRAGVVRGPEGYRNTDEDIAALPAYVRDTLADSVQGFAELDAETRVCFR